MAKTKISQFDANAANNTDLNSISIAEGTAPSNINNAIRELMSQLADLNLGNEVLSTLKIDNLHLDGNTIVTLDTNGDLNLTPNGTGSVVVAKVDINGGAIDGTPIGGSSASTGAFTTLSASSTANLGSSVTVSGGNIDGVIGANTPAAITGTVITANTNFAGNLTGNVTGTVDGVVGGTTPAAITGTTITANTKFVGAIDGNVTATSGTSTFNNVTINGTLDMDSTTSQTITGLATPSGSTDAATKGYVDTEVSGLVDSAPAALNTLNELAAALGDDASFSTTVTNSIAAKLPLAGGTMTGDINANSNTVSGLKAPSSANDATTKTYVDTADALKLNLSGGTLSGNLAMGSNKVTGLDTPTATGDATTKGYVDGILGSATAAATSASAAATSATASATSATASASSATAAASSATSAASSYDSFDDRYLGAKGSAPTVDNDGDALLTGALYFNTSSNQLFVWTSGDAWVQAAFTASGFLSGANNLSDVANAGTSRTNLGLGTAATTAATDYATAAQGTKADNAAAKASNLSDLASASTARTNLGLGTAATQAVGTSASNVVQLDGSAKLPAVDGSALTGLASGGTVNMVADGAIAIRKPVVLTAAGKAKEVAETTTETETDGAVAVGISSGGSYKGITNNRGTAYESTSDAIAVTYRDADNSSYPTAAAASYTSGEATLSWGTPVVLKSEACPFSTVSAGGGKFHATWTNESNAIYARWFTVSGNTITLASSETTLNTSSAAGWAKSVYADDISRVVVIYGQQSVYGTDSMNGNYYANILEVTGSAYTASSKLTILENVGRSHGSSGTDFDIVYDPDTDRILFVYMASGGTKGRVLTASTSAITVGAEQTVDGSSNNDSSGFMLAYDTNLDRAILSYTKGIGSAGAHARVIAITGGGTNTLSVGAESSQIQSENPNGQGGIAFNSKDNKTYLALTGSGGKLRRYELTCSTTAITSIGTAVEISSAVTPFYGNIVYNTDEEALVTIFQENNSVNKDLKYQVLHYASSTTTTLTSANYLGIAAEAISDTATGKINVIGGISEGHSSLAIGTNYFATGAGAIATSGTQLIGKALSATEIQLGVKSGTAAHNTVALDANAKLPAVDGSQLTNLPSPSDARVFCGSYDFRVDGSSTAQNVLISLPSGYTAANVRSYEINVHGVGFAADGNFLCMLPYNGSSSVYSGSTYNTFTYMNGNSGTATNNSKTQSTAFILNWANSTSYDLYSANDVDNPKQNYDNASGHGGQLVCRAVYTNSLRNGSLMYDASWRYGTQNNGHSRVLSIASADAATTSNYADGFYFYIGNDSQAAQSTAIMEGVVSVYAIIG